MNRHQIIINSVACDIERMFSKVGIFHRQYSHPEVTRSPALMRLAEWVLELSLMEVVIQGEEQFC